MKNTIQIDDTTPCFLLEKNVAKNEFIHFHNEVEVYGVLKGRVLATVAGERMLLEEGEFVIINQLENHCYEVEEQTEILVFNIGVRYLRSFFALYPNKKLPRWLKDVEFNKTLNEYIENNLYKSKDDISELRKIGDVCQILSHIIEHYGLMEKDEKMLRDEDLVTKVVEYIYEHYSEDITLESLAERFHMSSSALSKKLSSRIGMDLRMFVNDIRVQKVVQMLDEPQNEDKTISEIAFLCGFSSMSTFYRCYKRNFGFKKLDDVSC